MADYGVLSKVKSILKDNPAIQDKGLSDAIFVALPPELPHSMVTLEIEEIWSSIKLDNGSPYARIKFKASSVGEGPTGKGTLNIADNVRQAIDGKTLELGEGHTATFRLANSVIDLPKPNRTVHQYYEALVR